jgi:hypothetical protein
MRYLTSKAAAAATTAAEAVGSNHQTNPIAGEGNYGVGGTSILVIVSFLTMRKGSVYE